MEVTKPISGCFYLGLDGGGTKTAALILDAEGRARGRGAGGPGNIASNSEETLRQSVLTAMRVACEEAGLAPDAVRFAGVCAGMAGYSDEIRRAAFFTLLREIVPLESSPEPPPARVLPDYEIAYWGAAEGEPGIIAVAGTGAVVFGRNAEGETHREDGLGFLLGDQGSGFDLGLRALRHTLNRMQQGQPDALAKAVIETTEARSQNEIIHWLYSGFHPTRVAALAPVVGTLAEAGDPAARDLLAEMARRLRHSVRKTRLKLWLPRSAPVYPLGGLWQLGSFFRQEFEEPRWQSVSSSLLEAEETGGRLPIAVPKRDAVYGAALLAKG